MNLEDERFLILAAKVARGKATGEERTELERLLSKRPELRSEFHGLEHMLRREGQLEFWDSALRVIFGTASPDEVDRIESLKQSEPEQWEKYQDVVEFIDALASRPASLKDLKVEPMPPRVREELLKNLKEAKATRRIP